MGDENVFDFESVFFGTVQDSIEESRPASVSLDSVNNNKNQLKQVRFNESVIEKKKANQKPFKRKKRKLDSGPESKEKTKADYSMLMVDGQLKRFCELCDKIGKSSRLKLYQVNFDEAFYMCENVNCSYPLDIEESCSQSLVTRDYRNITTASQRRLSSVTKTPLYQVSSSVASRNLPILNQTLVSKQPLKDTPVNVIQNKSVASVHLSSNLPTSLKPSLNLNSQKSASTFFPFQISKGKNSTAKSVTSSKSAKTVNPKTKSTTVTISEIAAELLKKRRSRCQTPDSPVSSEGSAAKRQRVNSIFKEALQSKQVKAPRDRVSPLTCALATKQSSVTSLTSALAKKQSVQPAKTDSALVKPKGKGVAPQVIQQILKDVKEKAPPLSVLGASKFAPFSLASAKPTSAPASSKQGRKKKDKSVVQEPKSTPKNDFPAPKPKLHDSDILKAISKRVAANKDSGSIRKIVIKTIPNKKVQNAAVQVQNQTKGSPILSQILKAPPNQFQSYHSSVKSGLKHEPIVNSASDTNISLNKNVSQDSQNFDDYCDSFDISIFDDIVDQQLRNPGHANLERENTKLTSDWEGASDGHSLNSSGNSSPKHSPYNKNSVEFDSLLSDSQLDEEVSLILSPDSQSLYTPIPKTLKTPKTRSSKKTVGTCIQKQVVKQLQNIVDKSYLQALRRSPVEFDESGKLSASISLNALGDSENLVVITDSVDNLVSSEISCEVIETGR